MDNYITTIERYVLESLQKSEKTLFDLVLDTKLEPKVLKSILFNLQREKFISQKAETYSLNHTNLNQLKSVLKNKLSSTVEISQIVKSNIKESFINKNEQCFKIKKVSLNKDDAIALSSMLLDIENFLKSRQDKKGKTSEEKIIFWGMNNYLDTINNLL